MIRSPPFSIPSMGITLENLETANSRGQKRVATACFHCGTPCREGTFPRGDRDFCCNGCLTVFEVLTENGLGNFYELADTAGVRVANTRADQFRFLDEPLVRERLVDFQDDHTTRVTFRIPSIHCIACVWLLENLFRLREGIGQSQVNFPRKEVAVSFENARIKLSEVVALLASLGYEPELKLSDLETAPANPITRRLWLQTGVAGFAFGNLMLFSLATYFGLDVFSGPTFRRLVGFLSLALALPVVIYSALDYWRTAWASLRQKRLAIEVPIAAGIVAIFVQSSFDLLAQRGEGYFDSLCGLIFFLLCGRLFQQKTFDRLSFERDYKSFFPLSVTRRSSRREETPSKNSSLRVPYREFDPSLLTSAATGNEEEQVSLSQLGVGDTLIIRNGELIPADARLVAGPACIDYSFVTGEAEPVAKRAGDYLYAGGRQIGGAIEVETVKAVSQSYLTSLWNQEAFRKDKGATLDSLTNLYSYRFTKIIIAVAIGAAVFWAFVDPGKAVRAFTAVLIVACPCALALAAPFTLGTALRVLGRRQIFVKSAQVLESLARVDTVVFDKTGTLTAAGAQSVEFGGEPLRPEEEQWIHSVAHQSTHPLSARIAALLAENQPVLPVRSCHETTGGGVEGIVDGRELALGSAAWLVARGVVVGPLSSAAGSCVHVAINGQHRGCFVLESVLRTDAGQLVQRLSEHYEVALLSGDNDRQRDVFAPLFGAHTRFQQSPLNKLEFIHNLQRSGQTVMMVGDGLNDAGALQQSDVGVAVVEKISAFSPASDIILSATMVPQLHELLVFSKRAVRVVRWSFLLSSLYNVVGLSIAASGRLAPVVCAILMPLSSITVVAFACGATAWAGRRLKVGPALRPTSSLSLHTSHPSRAEAA